jgi:26S proteasome regulatory subunit T6
LALALKTTQIRVPRLQGTSSFEKRGKTNNHINTTTNTNTNTLLPSYAHRIVSALQPKSLSAVAHIGLSLLLLLDPSSASPFTSNMALDSFFHNKIESMKLEIIQGQAVLRRLEAQRNDYNSRGNVNYLAQIGCAC